MGALAGVVHFRGDAPDPEVVDRMSARQAHRGPDGHGTWREGPAAFAHRLRSVAPSASRQPLVDGRYVVMLDGLVYDRDELVARAGHDGPVPNDVAGLLVAWRRWGIELASRLDGAYAVAVWDRDNRVLHLLRDRMGIRPLFWARSGDRFAFASELPALLEVPWVSREIAREHVAEYLSFRVVHAPRTLLRDVHQVEPAHWLRVHADALETRRYWSPVYAPPGTARPRESDVIPALQEAVERSVHRRLRGGPSAGLYLSGGLGSTAIAAAARRLNRDLPSFTVRFADDPFPESPFAGRVARLLGLEHHEVVVGTPDLAQAFHDGIRAMGHPIGNPALFLQLLLARAASDRVKVVLSGDGSVELFGGRMLDRLARNLKMATAFSRLPRAARAAISRPLGLAGRGTRLVAPLDRYGLALDLGGSDLFSTRERLDLLREPVLARPMARRDVLTPFYEPLDTDPINAVLNAFVRSWLSEESLARADRTGAAAGIATRFPLLDQEIVSMAAALPGAFKVRRVGGSLHTRWPLRAMLSGVLPPPLVNRPKRGMPTPLDGWLAGPGRLFMEERYQRLREDRWDLWKTDALERLHRSLSHQPGAGIRLWALFVLDAWLDEVAG